MVDEQPDRHFTLSFRELFAVGIGNALEFYDFIIFSFFAIQIGHTFFPVERTSHGLLFALATFGAGFMTRPLGAFIIGRYGDHAGRKPAMLLSFALMGVSIVGLALSPSYALIGILAPILLVTFRLLQGFALGGEIGPSTSFLLEAAPAHRRGLYVSVQATTQGAAILVAGLTGFALSHWMSAVSMDAWGWRTAYLLGALVVPVGLYVRKNLPETLHAETDAEARMTEPISVRLMVLSLTILAAATIATYARGYMTTYVQDSLRLSAALAFGATIINGMCGMFISPFVGILSDRIGRKPILVTTFLLAIALTVPGFILLNHFRDALVLYAVMALLSAVGWAFSVAALVSIAEAIPKSARSASLSVLYAGATAVFGGTTQFVIKLLIDATHNPLAPAWYSTATLILGALAAMAMRETYRRDETHGLLEGMVKPRQ